MQYPTLTEQATTRQIIDVFGGYNHNLRIGDGEFYDERNLCSDDYPLLTTRRQRGVYASPTNPQGMIAKDALCYVDGSAFVINERRIEMNLSTAAEDCPKSLVSMGAYVIILPDKKYINTAEVSDRGSMEATYTSTGEVTFSLCTADGGSYGDVITSATAPEKPANGAYWLDMSGEQHALKVYSSATGVWSTVATTYVKIYATGIGAQFAQYDGVNISGIVKAGAMELNGAAVVWARDDDYIVVTGLLDTTVNQTVAEGAVTVKRSVPDMDFVIESGNRLWGCKYGYVDGKTVNEIYASKLGDFKNWSCYMGLSTDSYAASCGTDGAFTGATAYMGNPVFFKETCLHKVYGNYPANFQIQTTACRGVQKGSYRSLAVVNEVLYYKAGTAVCAYDGSIPTEISYCLGAEQYKEAVGGALGNKYYISMLDSSGKAHLFVWDTAKKLWHREDGFRAARMESLGGTLYAMEEGTGKIWDMTRSGDSPEDKVKWSVETGEIGLEMPDMKYLARMIIRMSLEAGTEVRIYARYDFSQDWEPLFAVRSTRLRSFDIPVRAKRCDYMQLRIEGDGPGKIYSITKTIQQGSGRS